MRKLCMLVVSAALFFSGISAVFAKAAVPAGYPSLCLDKPQFCVQDRVKIADTRPHKNSAEVITLLQKVNTKWNRAIRQVPDKGDHWTGSTTQGDCEEVAIAKRMDLLRQGFTAAQVLLVLVRNKSGEWHLITAARVGTEVYVLDNLQPELLTWKEAGYVMVSRQSEGHPYTWTSRAF